MNPWLHVAGAQCQPRTGCSRCQWTPNRETGQPSPTRWLCGLPLCARGASEVSGRPSTRLLLHPEPIFTPLSFTPPATLFFNLHFTPLSLIPLSRCLFLSFFLSCESVFVRDKHKRRKKKSARFLATHLDPSMSLSLSSFFILLIHFLSLCIYFAAQLAKKTSRTFSSLAWQPVKTKKYVHFTKQSHAA